MVAMQYVLAVLLVCAAASARHHKLEQTAEISSDSIQTQADTPADTDSRRHRRKRWYNSYGYQPPGYRDDGPPGPPPAPYDPFAYIYRRLDELTALIRQPFPPPQPPILVPYPVYFNPATCGCQPPGPPTTGTAQEPMPNITIPSRGPEKYDDDYDDMPLRPLSFEPVKPDRPLSRPVPGVEHGSSQAGSPSGQQGREPSGFVAAAAAAPAAENTTPQPSRCDIATLTCCHQRYATNQCFASFGCTASLRGNNPCDARTISNVVSVFQNFYRNN